MQTPVFPRTLALFSMAVALQACVSDESDPESTNSGSDASSDTSSDTASDTGAITCTG